MKALIRSLLNRSILITLSAPMYVSAQVATGNAAVVKPQGLEEILVTARRKEEKLQDVPTSITALSARDLADMKIDSIVNVGQTIPNLYIQQQGGSIAPQLQLRGISNGSLNVQVDAGIGFYVDGVYFGRLGASTFDIADLAQIEVMRGPQGTLFGRNSTGGAINLITQAPTGQFGFHAEAGFGNYNDRRQKVSLDLPEWAGLSTRITLGHHQNDGYVRNSAPRNTFHFTGFGDKTTAETSGANDNDMAVIALRYTGVRGLKVDYKYDYSKNIQTMPFRQVLSQNPVTLPAGITAVDAPVGFGFRKDLPSPFESPIDQKVEGHSLTAEYELNPDLSVKYIGGFRKYDLRYGINQVNGAGLYTDGTSYYAEGVGIALRNEAQHQSSHEFQLLGKNGNFDWIGGVFLFEEKASNNNPIWLNALVGGYTFTPGATYAVDPGLNYFIGQNVKVDNKSKALYAHGTWHLGSQWDISGGFRHTQDDRVEHVLDAGRLAYGSFVILPGKAGVYRYNGSHNDYDLSATYKIDQNMNVYVKYATGYVSGGVLQGGTFDPETVKSYEAGFKGSFLDNRLRFNAAIYEMKRKGLQVEGFAGTGYVLQTVGKSKSDGLEMEVSYMPVEGLTLNGSYGYNKVETEGQIRTYQPKQTASAGVNYRFQRLGNGVRPSFRMDLSWRDDAYRLNCPAGLSQVQLGCGAPGEVLNSALDQQAILRAQTQLSARFTLSNIELDSRTTASVSVWGRNLLNNNKPEFLYTLGGNDVAGIYQKPKTYGIDFTIDY